MLGVDSCSDKSEVSPTVVSHVTCDLVVPVVFRSSWKHLSDVPLAYPYFGRTARIDVLLRVDIFVSSLLHGQWIGPPGSPRAFETKFGWVIASLAGLSQVVLNHLIPLFHRSLCTSYLSLLVKIFCVSFGKLRKVQGMKQISPLKSELLCIASRNTIATVQWKICCSHSKRAKCTITG